MRTIAYLCKTIRMFDGKSTAFVGEWVKRVELPIPPFVGLEVCARDIEHGDEIKSIWITPRGAVVCDLKDEIWTVKDDDGYDVTPADWPKTLAYETEGWMKVDDGDVYESLEP